MPAVVIGMNHFAEAEQLITKASECVVPEIERRLVARAAVHAQLAHIQVIEDAHGLQPAGRGLDTTDPDVLAAYGVTHARVETRTPTGERL